MADDEAKTGRVCAGLRTISARRRDEEEVEQPHGFLGQLDQRRSRTRSAKAPITARYRNPGPEPEPEPGPMPGIARPCRALALAVIQMSAAKCSFLRVRHTAAIGHS